MVNYGVNGDINGFDGDMMGIWWGYMKVSQVMGVLYPQIIHGWSCSIETLGDLGIPHDLRKPPYGKLENGDLLDI